MLQSRQSLCQLFTSGEHFQACCIDITLDLFSFPVSSYGCPLIVALTGSQGNVSIIIAQCSGKACTLG